MLLKKMLNTLKMKKNNNKRSHNKCHQNKITVKTYSVNYNIMYMVFSTEFSISLVYH